MTARLIYPPSFFIRQIIIISVIDFKAMISSLDESLCIAGDLPGAVGWHGKAGEIARCLIAGERSGIKKDCIIVATLHNKKGAWPVNVQG